jgi:hypothetical protein
MKSLAVMTLFLYGLQNASADTAQLPSALNTSQSGILSSVENGSLSGVWQGKSYSIDLSDTFDDIDGNWGDIKYDLDVSETFNDIDGEINGMKVDINVSSTFSDVDGTLPCGKVDYDFSETFKEVSGVLCGQSFSIDLDHKEEVIPTAQAILMDALLEDFPAPAQGAVRRFILARLKFNK